MQATDCLKTMQHSKLLEPLMNLPLLLGKWIIIGCTMMACMFPRRKHLGSFWSTLWTHHLSCRLYVAGFRKYWFWPRAGKRSIALAQCQCWAFPLSCIRHKSLKKVMENESWSKWHFCYTLISHFIYLFVCLSLCTSPPLYFFSLRLPALHVLGLCAYPCFNRDGGVVHQKIELAMHGRRIIIEKVDPHTLCGVCHLFISID